MTDERCTMLLHRMKTVRQLTFACLLFLGSAAALSAQTYTFQIDPEQSRVAFTLADVLHTVHGTFRVKSGSINFDTSTGSASGLIVVDARSGDSGNKARDRKMHKEILESEKFPEITFAPQHVRGELPQDGNSQVTIDGLFTLHGQSHPLSITVPVTVHSGTTTADLAFDVPYVQWGLKNPSTFILKVSQTVSINLHAVGRLQASKP